MPSTGHHPVRLHRLPVRPHVLCHGMSSEQHLVHAPTPLYTDTPEITLPHRECQQNIVPRRKLYLCSKITAVQLPEEQACQAGTGLSSVIKSILKTQTQSAFMGVGGNCICRQNHYGKQKLLIFTRTYTGDKKTTKLCCAWATSSI